MPSFVQVDIRKYDSPLDLIHHLLEVNQVDIYDIPIFDITEQYLEVLKQNSLAHLDMELASEFLVMAASLMQIKSKVLLPAMEGDGEAEAGQDPREELVLRLLVYRRNKQLAEELAARLNRETGFYLKDLSTPQSLGLSQEKIENKLDYDRFLKAVEGLEKRNALRFNDQSQRIKQLLKREKFSVKDKMVEIVARVFAKTRTFFSELFPLAKSSKSERVSGFLAVLELIRQNKLTVKQPHPFAVMMIELDSDYQEQYQGEGPADLFNQDLEEEDDAE